MATPIESNTEGLREILQRAQELPREINADDFIKKTEVVNNFTTMEEGFVADARAVKVLNDEVSKRLRVISKATSDVPNLVLSMRLFDSQFACLVLDGKGALHTLTYYSKNNSCSITKIGGTTYYTATANKYEDHVDITLTLDVWMRVFVYTTEEMW